MVVVEHLPLLIGVVVGHHVMGEVAVGVPMIDLQMELVVLKRKAK
jgi:hypothetical protein